MTNKSRIKEITISNAQLKSSLLYCTLLIFVKSSTPTSHAVPFITVIANQQIRRSHFFISTFITLLGLCNLPQRRSKLKLNRIGWNALNIATNHSADVTTYLVTWALRT
ncbi:hypothetical protein Csa_020157 [Cucumis sativus]|uniref:Uncharacterized protein n=1 Tax=Cucumis sativus TaxID=3659 RepID=A0A0A0K6M5_CUCSA|nr:hypothetical protein Csa_020157 [Cucumis sativus]